MTDTETTGLREMFILHGSQEEGPQPAMQDHTEKHQTGVRGYACMARASVVVSMERKG